jgi:hypothetical protein
VCAYGIECELAVNLPGVSRPWPHARRRGLALKLIRGWGWGWGWGWAVRCQCRRARKPLANGQPINARMAWLRWVTSSTG